MDQLRCRQHGLRLTTIALLLAALLGSLPMSSAVADDNVTPHFWASRPVPYLISTTVPSSWRGEVIDAANEWTSKTPMDFKYIGLIQSTDWTPLDGHLVWRGAIPQAWQSGCPPATTLACTNTRAYSNNQIADSDFVFNSSQSMGTSNTNCNLFGPFSVDVESVALHEFGHWGRLTHTTDGQAVMFQSYVTCRRLLHAHDDESMTEQYRGR